MQLVACEVALLYVPDGQAARRGTEECNQPDEGGAQRASGRRVTDVPVQLS